MFHRFSLILIDVASLLLILADFQRFELMLLNVNELLLILSDFGWFELILFKFIWSWFISCDFVVFCRFLLIDEPDTEMNSQGCNYPSRDKGGEGLGKVANYTKINKKLVAMLCSKVRSYLQCWIIGCRLSLGEDFHNHMSSC